MPNMQPLSLIDSDGTSPPHVFTPRDLTNNVATFVERKTGGIPLGDSRLSIGRTRTQTGREKISLKFAVPAVVDQTVNGVPSKVVQFTNYADLVFTFDGQSSTDQRSDLATFIYSLFETGNYPGFLKKVIVDGEGLW